MTLLGVLIATALLSSGCGTFHELMGFQVSHDPTVSLPVTVPRWALIKNLRFGGLRSEPEHIWVEEDKIPRTSRQLFGKQTLLAPLEVVGMYGSPPGGGEVSSLHAMASGVDGRKRQAPSRSGSSVGSRSDPRWRGAGGADGASREASLSRHGYVVFVDGNRIAIDLTARDGLWPGKLVSLCRDTIPIFHPVTGEFLGEVDEEIATAKVLEVRERFSVADVQSITPGTQAMVKDRVVSR